ncbi:MAG: hypothetical protein EDQ89_04360 [Acidobacteria bacterium]|nr:MAG: hypothetical protein EDQ89_04360 [Acidobacteriota bacterium]GIK77760.1 MAG: hypothetical protein BroJett022_14500 [Actinomycetes bacterium]
MRDARAIGPVGTAGRLLIGAFFLGPYLMFWASPGPLDFVAGLLLFPAAFIVAQGTYQALVGGRLEATGPWAMAANVAVAVLLFSIDATRPATAIFVGASLLLAAYRGYAGCEATAISNWILRRDDQIGCVVLAPLDAVDAGSSDPDHSRAHGGVGR